MNGYDEQASSVWNKYVDAKKNAFGETKEPDPNLTLEQLEAAIAEAAAMSGLPETGMPPRSVVHPAKRRQLSRWYYLALVILFSALVFGLLWWGNRSIAEIGS